MKKTLQLLLLGGLLFLSACGTIQVEVVTGGTPTLGPQAAAPAGPSIGACGQVQDDTTLPQNPDEPVSYIGRHYNENLMPEGLIFRSTGPIDDYHSWKWVSRLGLDMAFIEDIDCRIADGTFYTTVVDAIKIPRESPGYGRAGFCLPDRASGPFLIFGKYNVDEQQVSMYGETGWKMFDLDFGEQMDLKTMRFSPLSLDGVSCLRLARQEQ
jgi:hypothetical protein